MPALLPHRWDLSPEEAAALQQRLARRVVRADAIGPVARVAGVDVAYDTASDRIVGAVAVHDAATLAPIEIVSASDVARFPYVPGLFSFRELPALLDALGRVRQRPDLILCDGQGIAHPRRFGLACHLGLLSGIPTIGCAKSRLIGRHADPAAARGSAAPLVDQGETVGMALRTQDGIRPVYVSIGHRVSLKTACDWVLRLSPQHRLPETTRAADHAVRLALKAPGAPSME